MDTKILDQTELTYHGIKIEWVLTPMGRKAAKASDVVEALGKDPKDTSRLVNLNVFPDYRFQSSFGASGRPANYLYEQGVVQLATKIDSLEAEPFQRWVFETVVKIFTSGGYISPNATSDQLWALNQRISEQAAKIESLEATQRSLLSSSALSYSTVKSFAALAYIRDLSLTTAENERQHKYPLKCTKAIQRLFCAEFVDYFATSRRFKDLCDRYQLDPKFVFPDFGLVSEYDSKAEFPAWSMVWFLENIFALKYTTLSYDTTFVQNSKLAIA